MLGKYSSSAVETGSGKGMGTTLCGTASAADMNAASFFILSMTATSGPSGTPGMDNMADMAVFIEPGSNAWRAASAQER